MIQLESPALLVDVLPEVGGKVGQIRDKVLGCDLLVPAQRPYRTIPIDGDWLQHDTSGMDDCFPNVAAGMYPEPPWNSVRLPDLGGWSHSTWRIEEAVSSELKLSRTGSALPYSAVKTIRFSGERALEFSYRVENHGQSAMRYLWSAHPLIAVQKNFELQFPPGDLSFRRFPHDENVYAWPMYQGLNLASEWIPTGATLKVFLTGLKEGWCALALPGYTLRFTFDVHALPAVGIWLNNFGFPREGGHPFRCIAVEPCTSPSDLLDHLDIAAYPRIAPGESAEWQIRLSILPNQSSSV